MINSTKRRDLVSVMSNRLLSNSILKRLKSSAQVAIAASLDGRPYSSTTAIKSLEQVFTTDAVAEACLELVEQHVPTSNHLLVDPSAGEGAFYKRMREGSLAFDVELKYSDVIEADFLSVKIVHDGPIAVIGNPPFRLAVPFFNHAALQADTIAMILPKSFKRASVLCRLDQQFRLVADIELPAHSFLRAGKRCDVPAVFQIWTKQAEQRPVPSLSTKHADFSLANTMDPDFLLQRIGEAAGRVHDEDWRSCQGHLFVTATDDRNASYVRAIMNSLPLNIVAKVTSAMPSITRAEIVDWYSLMERIIDLRQPVRDMDELVDDWFASLLTGQKVEIP